MIYFMQAVHGGTVKIGHTSNVEARRKRLERQYGVAFVILATMEGGREEEAAWHARFDHLRYGRTEQFLPHPDLLPFTGPALIVHGNPEAVEAMKPTSDLVAIIHLKGSSEYAEWLDKAFDKTHIAKASMFRLAMIDWAKKMKLPAPPEI